MPSQSGEPSPVVIVGAGPVGLSLAVALARHGIRSTVLEQAASTSERSKAPAIHVRTREAFQQWGIAERFVEAGTLRQQVRLHRPADGKPILSLDFGELRGEADRAGLLVLEQGETERLLLAAAEETGLCDVRFNTTAVGVEQGADSATVIARDGTRTRSYTAEFVVGCDGAGSSVRDAVGQPFDGSTYSLRPMLADVAVPDDRDALEWPRTFNGPDGITTALRIAPKLWRIIWLHVGGSDPDDVTDREVDDRVAEVLGAGPVDVVWASRFRIHRRSSPRFRVDRVPLAGDAAHVHSPIGGLGMNAGIQDSHNLGWKLAYALRGGARDRLLESYEVERQAVVVESVSRYTDLLTRLFLLSPAPVRAGSFALGRLATAIGPVRRRMARRTAMIDLSCPASPILRRQDRSAGARLPNVELVAPDGTGVRIYDLLRYEPALIDTSSQPGVADAAPIGRIIRIGAGAYQDPSGQLTSLAGRQAWMLVRPDGHIAWSTRVPDRLTDAIGHALGGLPAS
jgi:2-polyprenyl-6-methoxyphenol hydroxylase-like FAD-dependent oxidoreductase